MGKSIIFSLLLFTTSCNNNKSNAVINKLGSAHFCTNVPNLFGNNADTKAFFM
jgi:hypothetical protein